MASSSTSVRSRAEASSKRFGSESPRIFTAPLRKLEPRSPATEKRTLGYAFIDFCELIVGWTLLPWQKWLAIHSLELLPDGTFRFRTVVLLVARQSGKSTFMALLALFFMYVRGAGLVIGTAQNLDIAEEVWKLAVDIAQETDELADEVQQVIMGSGKKALLLKTGERYKVQAANRRGGRGLSGDLVILDELREHQSWDAWGAITKTTLARPFAQIWAASNAGDAASIVLRYLRRLAHDALGDPDHLGDPVEAAPDDEELTGDLDDDSLGIFEWSAPPGCAMDDRDFWPLANPSLGYTITERAIASALRTDPEWVFRTEVLCQWSDGSLEGPFPPGSWDASADEGSRRADGALVALCVAVSWDRSTSHVCLASWRADGLPHVEVVASRAGTDWVVGWLTSPDRGDAVRSAQVAVQAKGAPESTLIEDLEAAGVKVVLWAGSDIPNATGALFDRVKAAVSTDEPAPPGLRHRNQPNLNIAASVAVPKVTDTGSFMWDRKKSPADVAPLHGVGGALWLLNQRPVVQPPPDIF